MAAWPERDRRAWAAATTPIALMAYRRRHGTKLGAETLRKIVKGYGRWLSFLNDRYGDSLAEPPDSRVTVPRLRAYFRALQHAGNADGTIAGRFYELQAALRLIAPDFDADIIRHLDGATMRQRLDLTPHDVTVPPIEDVMDWGLGMMQQADQLADPKRRLTSYRDGLLITVLAARGRRRRSLAAIRVGHELRRHGDVYVVELSADLVKTERADSFSLPPELTPYLDRYLQQTRPSLMGRQNHAALWVTAEGAPCSEDYLTNRMIKLTTRRFGFAFGPHRFRHSISTSLAYDGPEAAGLAAAVLSISPDIVALHYDRAKGVMAQRAFSDVLTRRKAEGAVRSPACHRDVSIVDRLKR